MMEVVRWWWWWWEVSDSMLSVPEQNQDVY